MLERAKSHPVGQLALRLIHIMVYRRVMGLSAEGAFWLVFSLPWLLLGMVSIVGFVDKLLPTSSVAALEEDLLKAAGRLLSPEVVSQYVEPLVTQIFSQGQAGITVVSFVIALWSGSRGIQTFIEANMVVNGQFRERGYLRIRGLAILLMLAVAALLALAVPLFTWGPEQLGKSSGLPSWLITLLLVLLLAFLSLVVIVGMLHASLTDRPSLLSSLPGAILMLAGWLLGAVYLSYYLGRVFSDASVYGVLAAPIAVMLYAFVVSMVAFLGAALNAALRGVDAGPEADAGVVTTTGAAAGT